MASVVELFGEFEAADEESQERRRELEMATAAYELAVRRVRVARERFWAEFMKDTGTNEAELDNICNADGSPVDWNRRLTRRAYLGLTLAEAARRELRHLKKATTEQIAFGMEEKGFDFRTESHAREVHAVLLRQPFTERKGLQWLYIAKD